MKETMEQRWERCRAALSESDFAGLLLNQPAYVFHFTDWLPPAWASVFLLVGPRDLILVTPFVPEDIPPVWTEAITYESFALEEEVPAIANANAALQEAVRLAGLAGESVGAVLGSLPAAYALPLAQHTSLEDAGSFMFALTAVKDEVALEAIRQRVGYLDGAFARAAGVIRPGVRESEVFGAIYTHLVQASGGPLTLDCNFGSGPRALGDEPQPTNKTIEAGEVVMIDLFPVIGGYTADYTRNFVVGQPTAAQSQQHAALEKALATAEAALRPGVLASELDRTVRGVLEAEGFGAHAYQHHTGHGFGLLIPEPPWVIPADHTPLQEGMVIAVEPGIYHPENGGMRLEGNYVITEDGCESLVGFPAMLIICE